ncbi:cytidylate kinase [Thermosporothrix hazakensis]|jgi:cytidylate kinase|nr:cytidylate kinase [Thermosporothrix sp. COM3]GCE48951.1 cytidylate kinase [Thermosporothrix hazakensis]
MSPTAVPQNLLAADIPPVGTTVITVTRKFASGGSEIARLVAERLGFACVDNDIISKVARRLNQDEQSVAKHDEQTTGITGHLLTALQTTNPLTINYGTVFNKNEAIISQSHEQALFQLTQQILLEAATQGNVLLVGRGSQLLLQQAPRTLHIAIFAPMQLRIQNVMRQMQLSAEEAAHLIAERDYEQRRYLLYNYGNDGQQIELYHLLINTGLFTYEQAADLICQALATAQQSF